MSVKNTISKIITIFVITNNFIFANFYESLSISGSDDFEVFNNPAGLAIDHGWETFMYGSFNQNNIENGIFYFGDKINGFAYYLGYKETDKFNRPTDYKLNFGHSINQNVNLGFSYNKNKEFEIGTLFRPFNFLSMGLTGSSEEKIRLGFALRPFFGNHKFTISGDFELSNLDYNNAFLNDRKSLLISISDIKGLKLTAEYFQSNYNEESNEGFNICLGVDLGKFGFRSTYDTHSEQVGLGMIMGTHQKNRLLEKKTNYISLTLDDVFIEEKPKIPKFEFDLGILNFNKVNPGTQLRTWLEKIDLLSNDSNVKGLVIHLKNISAGLGKRGEIRNALQRFKKSGKKIIIYSEFGIANIDYPLISMADEIYVNPLTGVDLRGLKMEVTFYRGMLDSLKIKPEVWRVNKDGKSYKSAGEPLLNTAMSDEMKENYSELLDDFYNQFVTDIANGRGWTIEKTQEIINNGPYWSSQRAIDVGLINGIKYPDEFKDYIKDLNDKKKLNKFKKINKTKDYVYDWKEKDIPKIAIIYAVGGIQSGKSNPGPQGSSVMGDKTIMKAIKSARKDKSIDAVILRIDSGGGSALASDQMWKEVLNTTQTDTTNIKPFIASMSDVAASGGYYIACQADTIISYPTTVTGSIGVIGIGLNLSDLYKRIGINKEVIKRGEFSDLLTQSRQWTEKEHKLFKDSIEESYRIFKERVINGRKKITSSDMLDEIALGRVWSGNKALENGLVDALGGINETIDLAKNMAGFDSDIDVEIIEFPKFGKKNINNKNSDDQLEFLLNIMPKSLKQELTKLNIIPILEGEKLYFIMPYQIDIN